MDQYAREFAKLKPTVMKLAGFALFGKKLLVEGMANFPPEGPVIVVGNHIGSYKDIAVLFRIAPRQLHFTANKEIFDQDSFNALIQQHLKRHLKEFGLLMDVVLRPLKTPFVNFISDNIRAVGSVPVDLERGKTHALRACERLIQEGRAVVLLQGRGRVNPRDPHPYVSRFRRGPAILCYNLLRTHRLVVPVLPIAMYGTQIPWIVPGSIHINVGKPLYITDYTAEDFSETISRFQHAMEKRIRVLIYRAITSRRSAPPPR